MDPIAYRRKLLKPEAKKLRAVLDLLDEKARAGERICRKVMPRAFPVTNVLILPLPAPLTSRLKTSGRRFIAPRLPFIVGWRSIR